MINLIYFENKYEIIIIKAFMRLCYHKNDIKKMIFPDFIFFIARDINLTAHSKHIIHHILNFSKRDDELNCGKKKEREKILERYMYGK